MARETPTHDVGSWSLHDRMVAPRVPVGQEGEGLSQQHDGPLGADEPGPTAGLCAWDEDTRVFTIPIQFLIVFLLSSFNFIPFPIPI